MPAKEFELGMDGVMYINPTFNSDSDSVPTTMTTLTTEINNAMDVKFAMEADEADATTRGNSGWKRTVQTLKAGTLDFSMLWKPGDTAFDALFTAFQNRKTVAVAPLSCDKDTVGSQGPISTWAVTNFSKTENLADVQRVDVTMKISSYGAWYEKAS